MNVSDVMTRQVTWVGPDATVGEIARRMRAEDIGSVPVAHNDRLIGMVTDRDIVIRGVADDGDVARTTARKVMSETILYCYADESVAAVLKNMGENQIRRLPVVDRDKRLVGIVSLGDLSRAADTKAGGALKKISKPTDEPASGAGSHDRTRPEVEPSRTQA
jgi:CBS domain-containing protein